MLLQRLLSIPVCLLAAASAVNAQENLSLADATARALAKNHAIRIERESIAAAEAQMTGAAGAYDPQLKLELNARHHRDPISSIFSGAPSGHTAATDNNFASSLSVSQLLRTGAMASLTTSASREGNNSALNLFQPAYFTSLGVELRQPLLRNRAIDPARAALRVTALDRDRSGAALERQVLQTVAQVESAYWALVAARRDLNVRRGSLTLAEQQKADTQVRVEARTVAVSDLAQPAAEVERRRGDVFAAQEVVARAERALKELMFDDAADPAWSVETMPSDPPDMAPFAVDMPSVLADAARYRPELAELSHQIAQRDVDVSVAKDSLRPQVDVYASYTMRGLAGDRNVGATPIGGLVPTLPSALSGGPFASYNTLFNQTFRDAAIGFTVDMPIGNRAARGQLGAAEASRRQTMTSLAQTRDRIAVEVRNAATALETAAGRIQAARAGLTAAEIQLKAEQDRFSVGLSTNFFVLTRQNDLALAQLTEIAALTDYRKAATELGRATGTLLRDRGIQVN